MPPLMLADSDTPAGPALDEAALVSGLRAGSPEAFERIVRQFGPGMLSVARRILRDDDEAREAVQEAFISAYRARRRFEGASRLSTWLHRIAVNSALIRLRRRRRRPEEPLDDLLPAFAADGHHAERLASWAEPPDVALERAETRALIRDAINRLPDNYRVVLLLRDIEQLTTAETAEALGLTPNAVKIRLHRARLALRTLIAPPLAEGPAT
jgi:RNA polymerase sigma-70 factor (ECF subfamily)